jgi:hypothetical protein
LRKEGVAEELTQEVIADAAKFDRIRKLGMTKNFSTDRILADVFLIY